MDRIVIITKEVGKLVFNLERPEDKNYWIWDTKIAKGYTIVEYHIEKGE